VHKGRNSVTKTFGQNWLIAFVKRILKQHNNFPLLHFAVNKSKGTDRLVNKVYFNAGNMKKRVKTKKPLISERLLQ